MSTRRALLAEQKFRPLKKLMQQTFACLKQSVQAETMPEKRAVSEFVEQVRIMVSYPGFGDEGYPALLSASEALAAASIKGDSVAVKDAVAEISVLQNRCHEARYQENGHTCA